MTKSNFLRYVALIVSAPLIFACGMTAPVPSPDGKMGSMDMQASTANAVIDTPFSESTEEIGRVIADALTIRSAPDAESASLGYLHRGDAVMVGGCVRFNNGDVWAELDGHYIAVLFEGQEFVEGVCE